jgi:N-acetylglucosaminylphosphatidylinositol deacetylase
MHALNRDQSNQIRGRNILLVIAHPDDEVMFFGPTLVGITNSTSENNVRVLCLSNGMSVVSLIQVRREVLVM